MSIECINKTLYIAGKGHNELYEIAIPTEKMRTVTAVIKAHVPENRGARAFTFLLTAHFSTVASLLELP
jgi:hypothetical protein